MAELLSFAAVKALELTFIPKRRVSADGSTISSNVAGKVREV